MKKEKTDKITRYWIEHSEYDLKTAEAMYKSRRYLYVTFMCQQAIEKILKAIITTISSEAPPKTHNLVRLAELAGIKTNLDQQQIDLLASLTPFCIEARYADYQEKMSRLTKRKLAREYLSRTKELYKCLSKMA
ncbi:HEPN domain-containing protein [Candidatus Saganbacteria bacterium]|nr:HEPN domain-containing protein [Candidatus Saganbacteria bacterium]